MYCKWNYDENWESPSYYQPSLRYDRKTARLIDLTEEEKVERSCCWSEAHSSYVLIANTERLKDNISTGHRPCWKMVLSLTFSGSLQK